MKPAVCVVSLLVGLLVALMPMAWASPVDPGWTKGLYDDGDHDDVIKTGGVGTFYLGWAFSLGDLRSLLAKMGISKDAADRAVHAMRTGAACQEPDLPGLATLLRLGGGRRKT
jgi:hypothetical protein